MNPDMQARLLKKYRDHAKHIEGILMINPLGHQKRTAAAEAFAACMDLMAHDVEFAPGKTPESGYWKCKEDCLTCYELAEDVKPEQENLRDKYRREGVEAILALQEAHKAIKERRPMDADKVRKEAREIVEVMWRKPE